MINLKYNQLRNIKSAIGVWLAIDSIAALIYFIVAISNGNNVLIALILVFGLVLIPGFMYLLADAVLSSFLYNGDIPKKTSKEVTPVNKYHKKEEAELEEFTPETRYNSDIEIDAVVAKKEDYAFHKELINVNIGGSVKAIGKQAFYGCENLETIKVNSRGVIKLGAQALEKVNEKLKVYVHPEDLELYMSDPSWEPYMRFIYPYETEA